MVFYNDIKKFLQYYKVFYRVQKLINAHQRNKYERDRICQEALKFREEIKTLSQERDDFEKWLALIVTLDEPISQ